MSQDTDIFVSGDVSCMQVEKIKSAFAKPTHAGCFAQQ